MSHAPNLPIDFHKKWEATFEFRILGLQSSTPECASVGRPDPDQGLAPCLTPSTPSDTAKAFFMHTIFIQSKI